MLPYALKGYAQPIITTTVIEISFNVKMIRIYNTPVPIISKD